ncbi:MULTISPECIES: DNA mismatch repair protein MutS [Halolamina]|uniref:DNA mismatch repair protein MutS n=1 Tax=Halolamina pelagica TaxID=699431 RepID=A0A1I5RUF1_9EURY|nr:MULTISPECIES: DNA mismatch repair protein MutS [Halolamina]NHX35352.1 DNA mismatch repair protein MutS [Halolamina sp. R1-12]SFP62189.1 DNA mismatch repair protein MutS [Halolamina pelagica]
MSQGIVEEFLSLKAETDADLLMMQCGDFYELFADDAEVVADELDLTISQKSSHGSSYPMAGVPLSELTPYLTALVERGYRVAVADQFDAEDGSKYREITRLASPGTLVETTDDDAQYLAAVVEGDAGRGESEYGLAFADITTGRFLVTAVDGADAAGAELYRFSPTELLPGPDVRTDDPLLSRLRERLDATHTLRPSDEFGSGRARHRVRDRFGESTLESIGLEGDSPAVQAAGAVLAYVDDTGLGVAAAMSRLQHYRPDDHLDLDATTQRNLELVETMQGGSEGSLFDTVDATVSSPGRRLLREWLTRPRRDRDLLARRHDAVEALASAALAREALRDRLDDAYDLERLASRTASGSADAGDLLAVKQTLGVLPALEEAIAGTQLETSPLPGVLENPDRETAAALRGELDEALREDPPKTVTQGGIFREGYDDELDGLIERHEELEQFLDGLAGREKREHGLSHVTVDRNKTDGYYIQVGKSVADQVPEHYREVKTLKNSKRFVTDELEEKEREIMRVEEARGELEYELFETLRDRVADHAELLQDAGRAIAEVDALASLADHAARNDWTRPELTDGDALHVEAGRHPVVETTTEFVPNDLHLDRDRRFLIVTGPNMSGKSTYMRQAALITLLAQAGSFVPARSAEVGLVDGIYTRVGALDELAQGRSTFMVEMQELSNILHSATEDSLVILDEVGRGTATYDGISIAWAATEYLHNEVRAKTLFATHYHELTTLADHLDGVANVHVAVDGEPGEENDVTFLRTVRDGPTDRSYGIHVADLAGVPGPVVDRAGDVLDRLREDKAIEARGSGGDGTKQAVFDLSSGSFAGEGTESRQEPGGATDAVGDGGGAGVEARDAAVDPEAADVLDELDGMNVAEISPVELMQRVEEWQSRLDE